MAVEAEYKPVGDDVPQVNGQVAVGEDLQFQRRWWNFERAIWSIFVLILVADLSGALGRGPLANAERQCSDGSLRVKYERVERENTSSIVTLLPGPNAIHNGQLQIFLGDTALRQLGAQRIIPQPLSSVIGHGGVTYTFPATALPIIVQIELKPSFVGLHRFRVGINDNDVVQASTFVLP